SPATGSCACSASCSYAPSSRRPSWSADIHVGYRSDFRCKPLSAQRAGLLVAVLPLSCRVHPGSDVQPQGAGPARTHPARADPDTGTECRPARTAHDRSAIRRRGHGDPRADRLRPAAGRVTATGFHHLQPGGRVDLDTDGHEHGTLQRSAEWYLVLADPLSAVLHHAGAAVLRRGWTPGGGQRCLPELHLLAGGQRPAFHRYVQHDPCAELGVFSRGYDRPAHGVLHDPGAVLLRPAEP